MEGGKKVRFAWRDGPMLKALKAGDWILLDEVSSLNCNPVLYDSTLHQFSNYMHEYIPALLTPGENVFL